MSLPTPATYPDPTPKNPNTDQAPSLLERRTPHHSPTLSPLLQTQFQHQTIGNPWLNPFNLLPLPPQPSSTMSTPPVPPIPNVNRDRDHIVIVGTDQTVPPHAPPHTHPTTTTTNTNTDTSLTTPTMPIATLATTAPNNNNSTTALEITPHHNHYSPRPHTILLNAPDHPMHCTTYHSTPTTTATPSEILPATTPPHTHRHNHYKHTGNTQHYSPLFSFILIHYTS